MRATIADLGFRCAPTLAHWRHTDRYGITGKPAFFTRQQSAIQSAVWWSNIEPAVTKAIKLGAINLCEITKTSVDLFATRNVFQNVSHSASSPHRNRVTRIELSIVEIEF